jgi:hypothetical protein
MNELFEEFVYRSSKYLYQLMAQSFHMYAYIWGSHSGACAETLTSKDYNTDGEKYILL